MIKKVIKKILVLMSIYLTIINSYATMQNTKKIIGSNNMFQWEFPSKDDGLFQLLGPDETKTFIVYVAESYHGKTADPISINCNAGTGEFKTHQVMPGSSLTCYPHYVDTIVVYIDPTQFKNGSSGTYKYGTLYTT